MWTKIYTCKVAVAHFVADMYMLFEHIAVIDCGANRLQMCVCFLFHQKIKPAFSPIMLEYVSMVTHDFL